MRFRQSLLRLWLHGKLHDHVCIIDTRSLADQHMPNHTDWLNLALQWCLEAEKEMTHGESIEDADMARSTVAETEFEFHVMLDNTSLCSMIYSTYDLCLCVVIFSTYDPFEVCMYAYARFPSTALVWFCVYLRLGSVQCGLI